MASKTASLLIRLTDDVSGPAAKAAGALKSLATAGDGLSRLKSAAAGLDQLGAKMRAARVETEKTAKELAAAERRVALFQRWKASGSQNYVAFKASGEVEAAEARLKAARRAHASATRQMAQTREVFVEQKRTVGALTAALGPLGAGMRQVAAAEAGVASAATAVNTALAKQPGLMSTASQKAAGLAKTYRDLAAGMSAAGRRQMDQIETSRRVVAGMSAPARAARAEAAARDRAELAATYAQGRRYQTGSLAGGAPREGHDFLDAMAGAGAAGLARKTYEKARDGYLEMDEATRRQRAILGIDEAAQKPLTAQALQIGQETRFSNADVVKAQTRIGSGLPSHLKTPEVLRAITANSRDYALAMGTTMDEASGALLGRMLGMSYDMSSPEAAAKSAKHAANRLVQFAKSSGADHNDVVGYTKFGAAPGQVGGFSEEYADALAAQLRRIGYEGSMAGNFVRAAATKLAVPTDKGRATMAANDIDHDDYVEPSKRMSADGLDNVIRLKFGKSLNASQLKRIADLMNDESVIGSREEFVPQVSEILQETLAKKGKKGKVNAQDAGKIAKAVNEYMSATSGAVDIERLMSDILKKGLTPAMAKYLFGQEHGGRAQGLKVDQLRKDQESFRNTPDNRASQVGEDINKGFYGAYQRMIGSFETLYMRIGQVNDGPLSAFYDKLGNTVDAVSGMPDKVLAFGTQVGAVAAGLLSLKGGLATISLFGVEGAGKLSALLSRLGIWGAAATAGVMAGQAVGEGLNEIGAVAAGKYWTPKDEDDLRETRTFRDEKRAQADAAEARVHPSRRGEFNPEVDRLRREVQDLDNRIRSGEEAKRAGLKLSDAARDALDARAAGTDAGATQPTTKGAPVAPRVADVVAPPAARPAPTPQPPARPPEFGGGAEAATPATRPAPGSGAGAVEATTAKLAAYRAELAQVERQLAGLQASGEAAFSPDLAGLDARRAEIRAAIAAVEAALKALKPVALEVAVPDFAPVVAAGAEGGTQAGVSAGQGVAKGIEQSSPEAIEKGRTLFERLKGLFQGGIDVPINLNVEGGSGGGVHKASWVSLPAEARAPVVRAAVRGGGGSGYRTPPATPEPPGPAVSPQAAFGDGVDVARLPAGMRNNNPGNIKYVGQRNALGPSKNTDQGDPQAVYASPEDGMRALVDLARRKWEGGRRTVSDLVARSGGWTPGNHAAAANIARAAGVGAHDRIDLSDDETMRRFVRGLITQEHGPASRLYSDDLIRRAIRPREQAPAQEAKAAPEAPRIPGMMPGAERVNPGYGRPLHQGGTGLSRYSDADLRAMTARQDALDRAKASPDAPVSAAPATDRLEAARRAIQGRYPAAPAPPAPTAVPGLTRPAPGVTPSGVPAIAPKGDTAGLDALGAKAGSVQAQLAALSAVSVAPQVSSGGLDGLIAKANAAIGALQRVAAMAGSANAAIASVNAGGAGSGGGGGDGAQASSGMVRQRLANAFV
ncbi:phage tail tape measure protein [Methylobacterium aquaticum]|uniref:TP901 family phage tail tape measure protein n=1 Tax=Methylobacterium aquaticum TaxID=270351 RepID=A0A0C6G2M3_9HYPH|nr:phage tail tape measure protein [Methylobacterium aquaticum]BAQ50410.1 TP901 family phage tail tape measure protein [Methylobacterium aquaticum]